MPSWLLKFVLQRQKSWFPIHSVGFLIILLLLAFQMEHCKHSPNMWHYKSIINPLFMGNGNGPNKPLVSGIQDILRLTLYYGKICKSSRPWFSVYLCLFIGTQASWPTNSNLTNTHIEQERTLWTVSRHTIYT